MVVSGNLLACVTSDGGLVIWEVPAELDENPPVALLVHVSPTDGASGLKLVKWHPKQTGSIAVASDREVYVFNINEARRAFQGEETSLSELAKISTVISVPLVCFSPVISLTSIILISSFGSPLLASRLMVLRLRWQQSQSILQSHCGPSRNDFRSGLDVFREKAYLLQ